MRLQATLGITEPKLSRDPLGTEGEMTPGPDDENPYDGEGAFGGDVEPDDAAFLSADPPLGGREVLGEIDDVAGERHEDMEEVFAFDGVGGAFEPNVVEQGEQFRW